MVVKWVYGGNGRVRIVVIFIVNLLVKFFITFDPAEF